MHDDDAPSRLPLPEGDGDPEVRVRREAVEAALVEGQHRILRFLVGRLGNPEDAHDVLHDFAIRAIQRSDDLRDVASVRGWLGRLLATAIADHHRRAARQPRQDPVPGTWAEVGETHAAPDAETDHAVCKCLHDLIGLLDPGTADLLRRIDLQGEPRADVAAALGLSEGTLAVRLHRARRKLRDLLITMCLTCPEHGFLDCGCDRVRARRRAAEALSAGGGP